MSSVSMPIYVSPLQTTKAKRRKKLFVDKKGYKEKGIESILKLSESKSLNNSIECHFWV